MYYYDDLKFHIWSLVVILGLFFAFYLPLNFADKHYETITVNEKTVEPGRYGSYLIISKYQSFEVDDSDVYSQLQVGNTYKVYVMGKRNHFWQTHKRIVGIVEIYPQTHQQQ